MSRKSLSGRLTVAVLGLFPPPVTGAAKNNQLMYDWLIEEGVQAIRIPTGSSGSALARSAKYHALRAVQFARNLAKLSSVIRRSGHKRLYCVPDGGLGAWYTLAYLGLAVRLFDDVVLHHRTFQYVDCKSQAMALICKCVGRKAVHVFLSDGMRDRFVGHYGDCISLVSTNARYVRARRPEKIQDCVVLGHLSNLCAAKGFFEVADTFEALRNQGNNVRLHLAGPIIESRVEERLEELRTKFPDSLEYYGEVHGNAKDRFYDRLHVFLFPTRWVQEAQPNVIYEAMAAAALPVATGRGCIPEMVPTTCGKVVGVYEDFVAAAVDYIRWLESVPGRYDKLALEVYRHTSATVEESLKQSCTLETFLIDPSSAHLRLVNAAPNLG